jgi:hypothetical protein
MKYEVIVSNKDGGQGENEEVPNIQFWANANWVNIPSDKKSVISRTALENLLNCVQMRPKPGSYKEDEEIPMIPYTRFPTTVLNIQYTAAEIKKGVPLENIKFDSKILGIPVKELRERPEYAK